MGWRNGLLGKNFGHISFTFVPAKWPNFVPNLVKTLNKTLPNIFLSLTFQSHYHLGPSCFIQKCNFYSGSISQMPTRNNLHFITFKWEESCAISRTGTSLVLAFLFPFCLKRHRVIFISILFKTNTRTKPGTSHGQTLANRTKPGPSFQL